MPLNINAISTALFNGGLSNEQLAPTLRLAIARILGSELVIPSEAGESANAAFDAVVGQIEKQVSAANEIAPVDFNATIQAIREFWTLRYNVVYASTPLTNFPKLPEGFDSPEVKGLVAAIYKA